MMFLMEILELKEIRYKITFKLNFPYFHCLKKVMFMMKTNKFLNKHVCLFQNSLFYGLKFKNAFQRKHLFG